MQTVDTKALKTALEVLNLGVIDLNVDWTSLGDEIEAMQALVIVEAACRALTGATTDNGFNEPAIMPRTRFDRVRWFATPSTRAILALFYDVDKPLLIELQGTFRHLEKNDPLGRRSRNWDGEFVIWALRTLRETRAANAANAEPRIQTDTTTAAALPDVDAVDLSPIFDDLGNRLGYARVYAGQLKAEWWPSENSINTAVARGVPIGFAKRSLSVQSFISVHTQQRHRSTSNADKLYVEYITDRFQTLLRVTMNEISKEGSVEK